MRLNKHINEALGDSLTPETFSALKKVNKNFLKETKRILKIDNHYLIRGMRTLSQDVTIKKVRTDRMPTDSLIGWHDAMNDIFQSKFGIRARSEAVFCAFRYVGYGNKYIIFPIGDYYFIYSRSITDLYNHEPSSPELYQRTAEDLITSYEKTNSLVSLQPSITLKTEIMMICREYVAVKIQENKSTYTLLDMWIEDNI
jgi:hypothetical protein